MKRYGFPFSPNCRKVRAVAYELVIVRDCVLIDILAEENRSRAFFALNANGRVPVLEDSDFVP